MKDISGGKVMKKRCISIAVFLALFMTGCETYEQNIQTALTTTETSETPSVLDEVTEGTEAPQTEEISLDSETAEVSSEPQETETGLESINLNYEAIATATDEVSTEETGSETGVTPTQYSSEDGRPPVSDDLKDFYTSALEVYSKIYYCSFTSDTTTPVWVNGKNGYTRVTDTRFPDYQSLYTFASHYFTDDLMSRQILPFGQIDFVEKYGAFYMAPATKVKNTAYAGHVFKLNSQTDNEIICTADVYYLLGTNVVNTEPIFYTEPSDKSRYSVSQVSFKLTKLGEEWKFAEFSIIN